MTEPAAPATEPVGPPPPGGPAVRWWWLFVAPLLAVLIVAVGAAALIVSNGDRNAGGTQAMVGAAPLAGWTLGQVPLNVAVRPTWTLRNSSDHTVTLGEPHAEVREGCCPGPATLGTRTLAPGASTTLTFELSMHPGMDGPHDLGLHVPVDDGSGTGQVLTLDVTGDFRS